MPENVNTETESDVLDLKQFTCMNITDEEKEILLSKNDGIISVNLNYFLFYISCLKKKKKILFIS